jgi:hypothetical protein
MGYHQSVCKAACPKCGSKMLWTWNDSGRGPTARHKLPDWKCECGARNVVAKLDPWPQVPRLLYIGHEKHRQLKLYPFPPDDSTASWAQPYSIRSFVGRRPGAVG